MSEAVPTSRGGLELLSDDLIDSVTVARNLETMRWIEQWMKVRDGTLEWSNSTRIEYPSNSCCLVQDVVERLRQKSNMLQGYGDTVLRAESLEKELNMARKHSAMLQSKLDGAFAQLLTVYFGAPSMFITLWFGFDYGTNPPLGTLII
jgi:hypothetical protein